MVKEFLIGSWVTYFDYSIMSYEDQTKRLAELGFNYNPFPFAWYVLDTHDDLDDWKEIDRINRKYGLYYGLETTADKSGTSQEAFERNIAFAKEMSDNCIIYHVMDEPNYKKIDMLAGWIKKYKEADKRVEPVFNLLPSYASVRSFNASYIDHLRQVVTAMRPENITFFGNDYYPFLEEKTRVRMFCDLEEIRKVAYESGKLRTHEFIQACQWKDMRMPTIEEISWQAYSFLAYGMKAISYFNVVCPQNYENYKNCLIMLDGTVKNPELLKAVGELNFEIRAVGNELISTDTIHAYHTQEITDIIELLPEDYYIKPINENVEVVITEHDDESLFMIVNTDLDFEGELQFKISNEKDIKVFDPKTKKYTQCNFKDGVLTVEFKKGKGYLFKKF